MHKIDEKMRNMQHACSTRYEFIKKLVSDVSDHHERQEGEEWRKALEEQVTTYVSNQFGEGGASSTYVKKQDGELLLIVCIESHQYNANNYWYTSSLLQIAVLKNENPYKSEF